MYREFYLHVKSKLDDTDNDRAWYTYEDDDYLLNNRTCSVLIKNTKEILDMPADLFDEFRRMLEREKKSCSRYYKKVLSYDTPVKSNEDEEITYIDTFSGRSDTAKEAEYQITCKNIREMIGKMEPMAQVVLKEYCVDHKTEKEIAGKYGMSVSMIHRCKRKAMDHIVDAVLEERI